MTTNVQDENEEDLGSDERITEPGSKLRLVDSFVFGKLDENFGEPSKIDLV